MKLSSRKHRGAAWASLLGALLLAACGGGGGGDTTTPPPGERSQALAVSQPGELAAYVQDRLRRREAAGLGGGGISGDVIFAAAGAAATAAPAARSGTTLQEAGVDEPDLLQSDGHVLYTLQPAQVTVGGTPMTELALYTRDAAGRAVPGPKLSLPAEGAGSQEAAGMVLDESAGVLGVVLQRWYRTDDGGIVCIDVCPAGAATLLPYWFRSAVTVQRVDVRDPAAPAAGQTVTIDGTLVASRRVGDRLLLVTSYLPRLPVDAVPGTPNSPERQAAIARTTAADVLPRMRRNGGAAATALRDTDCWTQPANASTDLSVTTITVLDLRAPDLAPKSRCFVGGSNALYMTPGSLYLATSRWEMPAAVGAALVYPSGFRTDVHKFAFSAAGDVSYRASASVPGHLGWNPSYNSYRFSEWNGDLRVITFTGSFGWIVEGDATAGTTPPSPATLTVLREKSGDATLQTLATLPNAAHPEPLGKPGEQVRAVRFAGSRGYVVTFRQIDPLYVLDLADPAAPRVAGALEVPGYSDQLFPLSDTLLLGVGRDVTTAGRMGGVKVALVDVADPAHPQERSTMTLGNAGSYTALDGSPHGLNWLVDGRVARLALPVALTDTPYTGTVRGLQRFEVDLAARTLRTRPMLGATGAPYSPWVDQERSLQIGAQVYYLQKQQLATYDW